MIILKKDLGGSTSGFSAGHWERSKKFGGGNLIQGVMGLRKESEQRATSQPYGISRVTIGRQLIEKVGSAASILNRWGRTSAVGEGVTDDQRPAGDILYSLS